MIQQLSALFGAEPLLFAFCMLPFGLIVGSFLNVVIYRLPIMMDRDWRQQARDFLEIPQPADLPTEPFNLAKPASTCPGCNSPIRAWHNIPVISYLFLKGRCGNCSQPISIRYPIVELLAGIITAALAYEFGFSLYLAATLILSWSFICLVFIDIDHMLLPDDITLPLLWLGILLALTGIGPVALVDSLIGAMAGYMLLWLVYWGFKLVTGKEGMGYGDFKLLAVIGAWLGWQILPVVILLSSVIGALVGISIIVFFGGQRGKPIPFGPYLAGAGWVALIWGEQINRLYLSTI